MKGRAVDLALIVGLVLVAGAIVWTLFSLGRSPRAPQPDGGPTVTLPEDGGGGAAGSGVVPVSPDGDADGGDASDASAPAGDGAADDGAAGADAGDTSTPADGGGADAVPGDAGDDAASDGAGEDGAGEDGAAGAGPAAGDRPDPEVPAASAPPVPESGPVELGRIGFSFVTGGAGACGIVLEPWTHVAVSRELLAAYGCGAEVTVTLDDPTAGRTSVEMVVADTMNEAFSRTANVYVGEDEPALSYGLTSGTIEPR